MDYAPYYDTLRRTPLFCGMTDADLDTLTHCFAPRVRRYARGELLLLAGYEMHELGIILHGEIVAAKPMPDGTAVVALQPEDTAGLSPGCYCYDVRLVGPGGETVDTIVPRSEFRVEEAVGDV